MFIPGTDFNGEYDQRTIYEQIIDPDSDKDLVSLYIYSVYWVLTVVTTVGYGNATYVKSEELIYACFLEVLATLLQAATIAIL